VEKVWDKFLTDRDRAVFAASGYGTHGGCGQKPALLIVDVSYGFTGDRSEPILESIRGWRNSCGAEAWDAVKVIKDLADLSRAKRLPVIYRASAGPTIGTRAVGHGRIGARPKPPAQIPLSILTQ
jgi:hypothetical protein